MKLAMPIFYGEKKYISCEIENPSGAVIADTKKLFDEGKMFNAFHRFLSGCITMLETDEGEKIEDRQKITTITRDMKQKSAEKLVIDILLHYDANDGIEGVYSCPRCHEKIICEQSIDMDTRDFISELEVVYYEEDDYFSFELDECYNLTDRKGNIITSISQLGFRHITVTDCIQAYARYGQHDRVRMQYDLYVRALTKLNNETIDETWRKRYGMIFFERYNNKDINIIAKEMNRYGLQTKVGKVCYKCGKEFKVHVNTANFFDSALNLKEE
jgi:hypothetical protein